MAGTKNGALLYIPNCQYRICFKSSELPERGAVQDTVHADGPIRELQISNNTF